MVNDFLRNNASLILLACLLCLPGCAPTKYVMQVDPVYPAGSSAPVFPAAPATPRYRYAGKLMGESNFVAEGADKRAAGVKLFHWLVGLIGGNEEKIELKRPQSGAVDAQGRVYVTDIGSNAVFVFDQLVGKLLVWQQADKTQAFVTPIGIAIGADGQLLVADAELGQVFRLDRDGKPLGSFGQGTLKRPTGLARDAQRGRIYVSDTHAHDVKVFNDDGRLLEVIGRRGEGDGEFNFPTHLSFGGDKLYVSDSMNARVQIFDAQGKPAGKLGTRGLYVGNLTRPKGVAVDPSGNIYVVESFYDHLLVFNAQGDFLLPIAGDGQKDGQFYLPAGVWSDATGRIYLADMFNGRIVIYQFLGGDQVASEPGLAPVP